MISPMNEYILTPYYLDKLEPGLESIKEPGCQINKANLPDDKVQIRMGVLYQRLTDYINESIKTGKQPVSIAGDCCTSISVLAGLQQAGINPTLIWLDAHGDFNTWETTPSGFLGGMPLAMFVGRGEQTIVQAVGLDPIPENMVILSDARDLDPEETLALGNSAVVHYDKVEAFLEAPIPEGPLYIHFDTDIIDPGEAPAMNYPAINGPSTGTLRSIFRHLKQTGRIVCVSLSAWNPSLDGNCLTKEACMSLLKELVND